MKRLIAAAAAAGALMLWLDVGSAQQPSTLRIAATTAGELRTWDSYVTAQQRAGDLRPLSVESDPSIPARTIERLQQYHQGVPVWGAQVVRDSDRGVPESIFGEVSQALPISTQPALSGAAAEQRVIGIGGADATLLRRPTLTILPLAGAEPRLAYMAVVSAERSVFRIFIDANTGSELLRYSEIQTQSAVGTGQGLVGGAKKISVLQQGAGYVADDRLRPPLLTTYDMRNNLTRALNVIDSGAALFASDVAADSDNQWTDVPTVDAHVHIGWTYDYYFKRHGRRGLDNRDRPLVTIVNAVSQQGALSLPPDLIDFAVNAFWCGQCGAGNVGLMFFGNGIPSNFTFGGQTWTYLAGSLDIAAHELTHGVTEGSSGLIYLNESGALNEAFSDMMGTSAEFYFQPAGAGIGEADFLIGEDSIRTPGGGRQGIRSMNNPAAFGDPDHYSIRYTGSGDNGGVHINSGIPNHAFYLSIVGGTNRVSGLAVTGVGLANREQIEKVFYRAFAFLLPANATFATARAATIQAARDLYGASSAAVTAVTQAWTAVGVL
ncbi:MAG TPA: M4 family metallopeptidase [Vicinamibacterales bacterium]|nr:M4 family metallopeptidase [Vicinamibacterales bacterium]